MSNPPIIFVSNVRVSLASLASHLSHLPGELYETSNHPDVLVVALEDAKSIGIKQVQDFIAWVEMRPYQAEYKLGLIYDAEQLTDQAQNALLKTLEEVNPSTQICLVTTNPHALLDTVRSRSIIIQLDDHSTEEGSINSQLVSEFMQSGYTRRMQILQQYCDHHTELSSFVSEIVEHIKISKRSEPGKLELCKQLLLSLQYNPNLKLTMQTLAITM